MKRALIPFALALFAIAGASLLLSANKETPPEKQPDNLRENGAL